MADNVKLRVQQILDNEKFKRDLAKSKSEVSGFAKSISTLGPMIAAAFSVAAVGAYFKTSLEGLDQQQKAEAKLLTALKGRKDIQQALIADASRLQNITIFGDEVTIDAYAQLAAFIKNEEALKRLMPLVQDMATAMNMDLSSAAMLVGKSLGSTTNALARYGIQIEGAVGSNERLENAITSLSDKFQGQAAAAADTVLGKVTQLKNAWGDLGETIAGLLVESGVTKVFKWLREEVSFLQWTIEKFKSTRDYGYLLNGDYAREMFAREEKNGELWQKNADYLNNYAKSYEKLAHHADEAAESISGVAEEVDKVAQSIHGKGNISSMSGSYDTPSSLPTSNAKPGHVTQNGWAEAFATGDLDNVSTQMEMSFRDIDNVITTWSPKYEQDLMNLEQIFKNAFASMGSLIAYSISEIVTALMDESYSLSDALNSITKMFGNWLQSLGSALIEYGFAKIVANAVGSMSGWGAIAAGIALTAAGAALASAMSEPAKFAEGGMVYGPTLGLMGEYAGARSNPEVIAPLSKLQNIMGSNQVEVVGVLRGEDIWLINKKHDSKVNRY